jgi:uncharacterized protein YciI
MPYVIDTVDKPNSEHLRQEHRPAHLDYLKSRVSTILAAGAKLSDDGAAMTGSLLIIDTEDRAEAEEFAANDPFSKAGLFASVTISRWRNAIFDRKMNV